MEHKTFLLQQRSSSTNQNWPQSFVQSGGKLTRSCSEWLSSFPDLWRLADWADWVAQKGWCRAGLSRRWGLSGSRRWRRQGRTGARSSRRRRGIGHALICTKMSKSKRLELLNLKCSLNRECCKICCTKSPQRVSKNFWSFTKNLKLNFWFNERFFSLILSVYGHFLR